MSTDREKDGGITVSKWFAGRGLFKMTFYQCDESNAKENFKVWLLEEHGIKSEDD